jgi:hypothetical protein
MPGAAVLMECEALLEGVKKREELWDKCYRLSEGITSVNLTSPGGLVTTFPQAPICSS